MILVKKMYIAKIKDIEDKIPDIAGVATNTTLNVKINQVKNKMSNVTKILILLLLLLRIKYLTIVNILLLHNLKS